MVPPQIAPPPSGEFLEPFQPPQPTSRPNNFIGIPPAPSALPLLPEDYYNLLGPPSKTPSNNLCSSQKQTLTRKREKVKDTVQKKKNSMITSMNCQMILPSLN